MISNISFKRYNPYIRWKIERERKIIEWDRNNTDLKDIIEEVKENEIELNKLYEELSNMTEKEKLDTDDVKGENKFGYCKCCRNISHQEQKYEKQKEEKMKKNKEPDEEEHKEWNWLSEKWKRMKRNRKRGKNNKRK